MEAKMTKNRFVRSDDEIGDPGKTIGSASEILTLMTRLRNFLALNSVTSRIDLALLVLRGWIGTSLFLRHGLEKFVGFPDTLSHFPDPLHLGTHLSFTVATISDTFCSILVVLGFATRWSALLI